MPVVVNAIINDISPSSLVVAQAEITGLHAGPLPPFYNPTAYYGFWQAGSNLFVTRASLSNQIVFIEVDPSVPSVGYSLATMSPALSFTEQYGMRSFDIAPDGTAFLLDIQTIADLVAADVTVLHRIHLNYGARTATPDVPTGATGSVTGAPLSGTAVSQGGFHPPFPADVLVHSVTHGTRTYTPYSNPLANNFGPGMFGGPLIVALNANQVLGFPNSSFAYSGTVGLGDPGPNIWSSWQGGCGTCQLITLGTNGDILSIVPMVTISGDGTDGPYYNTQDNFAQSVDGFGHPAVVVHLGTALNSSQALIVYETLGSTLGGYAISPGQGVLKARVVSVVGGGLQFGPECTISGGVDYAGYPWMLLDGTLAPAPYNLSSLVGIPQQRFVRGVDGTYGFVVSYGISLNAGYGAGAIALITLAVSGDVVSVVLKDFAPSGMGGVFIPYGSAAEGYQSIVAGNFYELSPPHEFSCALLAAGSNVMFATGDGGPHGPPYTPLTLQLAGGLYQLAAGGAAILNNRNYWLNVSVRGYDPSTTELVVQLVKTPPLTNPPQGFCRYPSAVENVVASHIAGVVQRGLVVHQSGPADTIWVPEWERTGNAFNEQSWHIWEATYDGNSWTESPVDILTVEPPAPVSGASKVATNIRLQPAPWSDPSVFMAFASYDNEVDGGYPNFQTLYRAQATVLLKSAGGGSTPTYVGTPVDYPFGTAVYPGDAFGLRPGVAVEAHAWSRTNGFVPNNPGFQVRLYDATSGLGSVRISLTEYPYPEIATPPPFGGGTNYYAFIRAWRIDDQHFLVTTYNEFSNFFDPSHASYAFVVGVDNSFNVTFGPLFTLPHTNDEFASGVPYFPDTTYFDWGTQSGFLFRYKITGLNISLFKSWASTVNCYLPGWPRYDDQYFDSFWGGAAYGFLASDSNHEWGWGGVPVFLDNNPPVGGPGLGGGIICCPLGGRGRIYALGGFFSAMTPSFADGFFRCCPGEVPQGGQKVQLRRFQRDDTSGQRRGAAFNAPKSLQSSERRGNFDTYS